MPDVITPTPEQQPADPSYADLRKMLADEPAPTPEPKPEIAVTPAATPAVEPEKTPTESETVTTQEPEKPKESAIDRRFSKLAKQRDEARADADRLRRELEASKSQPGPAETKPAEAAKAVEGKPVPPDPANWTGTWDSLERAKLEYAEKLADWKVSEALKARDQAEVQRQQQAQQQTAHAKWEERAQAAVAKDPEFQEAIEEIGPFVTRAGVADLIKQSEVGPEIVMHLFRHQEEGLRIAKLGNPVLIAREIGKLEAKLSGSTVPQQKTPAASPLPKPPAIVGGGGTPAAVDLNTCDQATFNREMRKMLAS